LGYHHIKIDHEDRHKRTFATEGGCYKYTAIFSRVVFASFKDYIHKFLEVYFDDWTMFGLLKEYVGSLILMLDQCSQYHISLNINKCIFGVPFRIFLGHIVCKQGLMVDPTKIPSIVNLPPPNSMRQFRTTLGHTGYYRKFIKWYAQITTPLEKLLKKDIKYQWTDEC